MNDFDYFRKQKENAFKSSYATMCTVVKHVNEQFVENSNPSLDLLGSFFIKLLKVFIFYILFFSHLIHVVILSFTIKNVAQFMGKSL